MTADTKIPLKHILHMRQHMIGARTYIDEVLKSIEVFFAMFDPVCKQCFYTKALIDTCECKKNHLTK